MTPQSLGGELLWLLGAGLMSLGIFAIPIHVRKASALLNALLSVKDRIQNKRVDIYCDN